MPFRTFLFSVVVVVASGQVDGMHDDDDDDGGERENRTRPEYRCMFKKQLEIIPFLFSSQTDREATKA
jgi:hypothetical protein